MDIKFIILLFSMIALASSYGKCPKDLCICNLDGKGRFQTICSKRHMSDIPIDQLQETIEVLIIRGPREYLKIGPIFRRFIDLEELRITDSNIPSIGDNTLWGVSSLRILGKHSSDDIEISYNKIK